MNKELHDAVYELSCLDILKGVFSIQRSKTHEVKKCVVRKLSDSTFQFERFTEKQAFHENVSKEFLCNKLCDVLENEFHQLQIFTSKYIYSVKITSKGRLLQNRTKNTQKTPVNQGLSHNKEKKHILLQNMEYMMMMM